MATAVRVVSSGGRIFVSGQANLKRIIDGIQGASWHKEDLPGGRSKWAIKLPLSPHAVNSVFNQLWSLGFEYRSIESDERIRNIARNRFGSNFLEEGLSVPDIPICKASSWQHQKRAFWFVADRWGCGDGNLDRKLGGGGAVLWLDMGVGKTKVAIDLIQNFKFRRTLIVAPAKVVDVWPEQWQKFGVENWPVKLEALRGAITRRALIVRQRIANQLHPLVFITNYEAFDKAQFCAAIEEADFDCVILDEGHRIKAPGGARSMFFRRLSERVPFRLLLSGTFLPNRTLDAYAPSRFIDTTYLGTSFVRFRDQYAVTREIEREVHGKKKKQVYVVASKNSEQLGRILKMYVLEIKANEVLDLPEEHHVDCRFSLSEEVRKAYDLLRDESVFELEDGEEIPASTIMTRMGKLQEVTGGSIRDPETGEVHRVGTEKRDLLAELLEDINPNEPVVVFARFRADIQSVKEAAAYVNRKCFELSGVKNELKEWKEATGGEILVAQISSGKEGVDFTRSHFCFYYSLTYQPGEFEQSKKRQHRPGQQAERVTYFHLIARDTIDEDIYKAITSKQNVIDVVRREVGRKI